MRLPVVARSPVPPDVFSNSYRALPLVAVPLGRFEPRRPRHSFSINRLETARPGGLRCRYRPGACPTLHRTKITFVACASPWASILGILIALTIQAVVFGDGGIRAIRRELLQNGDCRADTWCNLARPACAHVTYKLQS
jgi:hypothetical protein